MEFKVAKVSQTSVAFINQEALRKVKTSMYAISLVVLERWMGGL